MLNSLLIKGTVGCVIIVLPSFSAMSYSITVILIFWGLFCFLIMFSKQNTSYFHFSDVNCLPHAKAPTRYYVKVIKCFTYVGICSRQCSTVLKVWKLAQYCKNRHNGHHSERIHDLNKSIKENHVGMIENQNYK